MWKEITGYEGYYEVNENGVVRGMEREIKGSKGVTYIRKSKIITPHKSKDGYLQVRLSKDGKRKTFGAHKLVAMMFVDGYKEGLEVNHKDCDRTNNNYKNLEWVTHLENIQYTKSLHRHVSDRDLTGSNNPNYHNHTLRERFLNDPSFRMVQSKPGAQNGRAKPIRVSFQNGEYMDFSFLRECAGYLIKNSLTSAHNLDSVANNVSAAANHHKPYCGVEFKFI